MEFTANQKIEQILDTYLRFVQRNVWPLLILIVLLSVFNGAYVKNNLGINTDTTDMLSAELSWRQDYLKFKHSFPQFSDTILIVIDSPSADQTEDAALQLAQQLEADKTHFPQIYTFENSSFFRQNKLLYLPSEDLEELTDQLAAVQPFLAKLQQDQNSRGLFSLLSTALEEPSADLDLQPIFAALNKTLTAHLQNQDLRLSWSELISGQTVSADQRRALISVKPQLDYSQLLPGQLAIESLRKLIDESQIEKQFGVTIRLSGGATLAYEELDSVSRGAQSSGLIALVSVALVLIIGLGSWSLVIATLVTLITGLIWTAAFATFAIGELNMISVAFMVLYIGLGVDFAIHYCLRFREQRQELDQATAVRASGRHIGSSLILCAFTTAIGFYAFIPTAYSGVAELGLISGSGMFISLFLSLTLLPILLSLLPYRPKKTLARPKASHPLLALPKTRPKMIALLTLVFALISLYLVPQVRFDHNPVHLMDPDTESVQTYQDLLASSTRSPLSINILGSQDDDLKEKLLALDSVDELISLDSFIPSDQEENLFLIDDLALVMSLDEDSQHSSISDQDRRLAIQTFAEQLGRVQADHPLNRSLQALLQQQNSNLVRLEDNLLASFPGRLHSLQESLKAEAISRDTLPRDLRLRWQSKDQLYRTEVFAKDDLDDNQALQNFVQQVRQIAPHASGTPVINLEASVAVITAFQQAFGLALLVITLLLIVLLKRKTDSLMILLILLLSGLFTGAISVLFQIPFNFANIIALPLLLGIGVDSAIHIQHRYRSALPDNGLLLTTSTARAVLFSALTTACSFGNLAHSPHQGTASMGLLLTIGLVVSLFLTLFVLPAFLALSDKGVKTP